MNFHCFGNYYLIKAFLVFGQGYFYYLQIVPGMKAYNNFQPPALKKWLQLAWLNNNCYAGKGYCHRNELPLLRVFALKPFRYSPAHLPIPFVGPSKLL